MAQLQALFVHVMSWVTSLQALIVVVVAVMAVMFALYLVSQL